MSLSSKRKKLLKKKGMPLTQEGMKIILILLLNCVTNIIFVEDKVFAEEIVDL